MNTNLKLIGGIGMLLGILILSTTASGQTGIRKHTLASALGPVSNATVNGFLIVGQPAAERVASESMSGWVGFMPYKFEPTTGVEENELQRVAVAPNPSQTRVHISDVDPLATITVISSAAKLVAVEPTFSNGALILDVSEIPTGSYTAVIRTKTKSRFARFVVSR